MFEIGSSPTWGAFLEEGIPPAFNLTPPLNLHIRIRLHTYGCSDAMVGAAGANFELC